jgi:hypothetical protein
MCSTYILHANNGLLDGEIGICLDKFVMDDFSCCSDPCIVPFGIMEILKFVSQM